MPRTVSAHISYDNELIGKLIRLEVELMEKAERINSGLQYVMLGDTEAAEYLRKEFLNEEPTEKKDE